jgi:hypothetical protein
MDPQAQADAMYSYQAAQVQAMIEGKANEYGKQITDYTNNLGRQQSVLLKAVESAIRRGGDVSVQEILEQAAGIAQLPTDKLIDIALENLDRPNTMKAEIERQVAARLAEDQQKRDNESLKAIDAQVGPRPRFGVQPRSRQDEDRMVVQELRKQGINLLG